MGREDFDHIKEIQKLFRPTKARLTNSERNQNRKIDGWLTNGYWMTKSKYRHRLLETYRFQDPDDLPEDFVERTKLAIDDLLGKVTEYKTRLQIPNEISIKAQPEKSVVVKLQSEDHHTWANVYYINMFFDFQDDDNVITFWQDEDRTPIRVDLNGEMIGAVAVWDKINS